MSHAIFTKILDKYRKISLSKKEDASMNQLYWNIGKRLCEQKIVVGYSKSF